MIYKSKYFDAINHYIAVRTGETFPSSAHPNSYPTALEVLLCCFDRRKGINHVQISRFFDEISCIPLKSLTQFITYITWNSFWINRNIRNGFYGNLYGLELHGIYLKSPFHFIIDAAALFNYAAIVRWQNRYARSHSWKTLYNNLTIHFSGIGWKTRNTSKKCFPLFSPLFLSLLRYFRWFLIKSFNFERKNISTSCYFSALESSLSISRFTQFTRRVHFNQHD